MFPIVTHNRLYHRPMNETVPFAAGFIKATIRVVILATECSKPDEKNANKHHQTIINFAVSSFD